MPFVRRRFDASEIEKAKALLSQLSSTELQSIARESSIKLPDTTSKDAIIGGLISMPEDQLRSVLSKAEEIMLKKGGKR